MALPLGLRPLALGKKTNKQPCHTRLPGPSGRPMPLDLRDMHDCMHLSKPMHPIDWPTTSTPTKQLISPARALPGAGGPHPPLFPALACLILFNDLNSFFYQAALDSASGSLLARYCAAGRAAARVGCAAGGAANPKRDALSASCPLSAHRLDLPALTGDRLQPSRDARFGRRSP